MTATYPSLAGKGVVITGGATGIGAAMALAFAGQGGRVTILDIDKPAGEALAAREPGLIRFEAVDVTDTAALTDAIDRAAAQPGGLQTLIANAANDRRHTIAELDPALWDETMAINLKHQFFAAKAAHPYLRVTRGSVILMGSISWLNETTAMPAYTTAKAGVQGLLRTLARLWGPDGIRVNAILPGWVMTERQRRLWVDADGEALMDRAQCLGGRLAPEDIARTALFLASDEAAMITKQAIAVDGGWI